MTKGRFSFANLTGGAKAESEDKAKDENDTEAMDDEDDEASTDNDEAMDDKDDDEAKGFDAGRAAERQRIGSILSSKSVNSGNMAQAVAIACNTDLTPAQAADILAAGGTQTSASLSRRMETEPDPQVSTGTGEAKSDGWDAAAANAGVKMKESA